MEQIMFETSFYHKAWAVKSAANPSWYLNGCYSPFLELLQTVTQFYNHIFDPEAETDAEELELSAPQARMQYTVSK